MYELWLASQSPRRRELLEKAGFLFHVHPVKISESIEENVNLETAVMAIARGKADAAVSLHKHMKGQKILVLAADTMVVLGGRALGKPKNSGEALEFLRLLSGQKHRVLTAIALYNFSTSETFDAIDSTEVEFRKLSEIEMADYVATSEPYDKAGGYAVQGFARAFVAAIRGSESNVIGLPMELLEKTLYARGWNVRRKNTD